MEIDITDIDSYIKESYDTSISIYNGEDSDRDQDLSESLKHEIYREASKDPGFTELRYLPDILNHIMREEKDPYHPNRNAEYELKRLRRELENLIDNRHDYNDEIYKLLQIYILRKYGFDEDFIETLTNRYTRYDDEFIRDLTEQTNIISFLKVLSYKSPFTVLMIKGSKSDYRVFYQAIRNLSKRGVKYSEVKSLLAYPSGRPLTDMSTITKIKRSTLGNLPGDILWSHDKVLLDKKYEGDTGYLENVQIPVVRYGTGINGIFFGERDDDHKGTFYYYEPGSTIFLHAKRALVTPNKITAMIQIAGKDFTKKIWRAPQLDMFGMPDKDEMDQDEDDKIFDDVALGTYNYGDGMIDVDDSMFDQMLYKGIDRYDVIILSKMESEHGLTTEVVDLRGPEESFENLTMIL